MFFSLSLFFFFFFFAVLEFELRALLPAPFTPLKVFLKNERNYLCNMKGSEVVRDKLSNHLLTDQQVTSWKFM
jgi:hypothetical protein